MTFATSKFRSFLPAATFAMAAEFLMGLSDSVICGHIIGEAGLSAVNLMQGVVNGGTGIRLRAKYNLKGEIAGKTGTTNNQSDGWFIGYTPKLTAGVWVGGEDRSIHFESLSLGGGSNMALPIWGIFMKKVLQDGTLGLSEADRFVAPLGTTLNLDCDGSDADAEATEDEDNSFFFE